MKLSSLNSAIRKADKVLIWTRLPCGPLLVVAQKSSLLEALKAKHNGDGRAETGLYVRQDGQLMAEDNATFLPDPTQQESYEAQHAALHSSVSADLLTEDEDGFDFSSTPGIERESDVEVKPAAADLDDLFA